MILLKQIFVKLLKLEFNKLILILRHFTCPSGKLKVSFVILIFIEEELVCEFCHVPFVSKSKFERHKRLHTEDKPFLCVYCGESFSHHTELKRHRDEQHMSNKTFKCSSCPKTFSTRAELRGHLWRHTG